MVQFFRPPLCSLAIASLLLGLGCNESGQTEIARGNVLTRRRQFDDAAKAYQAAGQANPHSARPRELLGHLLIDQGKWAEARAAYQEAVRLEPKAALEARIGLARIDAEQGRLDEAVAELSQILKDQPNNLYALLSRENLALQRGRKEDAEQAIQDTARAMAIDPKSESVLYGRGRAFLAAGRMDQASQAFLLLRSAHPRSPLAPYGLARVAALKGDRAGAVDELTHARDLCLRSRTAWNIHEVETDPAFVALRRDPAFLATLKP